MHLTVLMLSRSLSIFVKVEHYIKVINFPAKATIVAHFAQRVIRLYTAKNLLKSLSKIVILKEISQFLENRRKKGKNCKF